MIARIWHGKTTTSRADDYLEYFRISGLRDYQATKGNLGVVVLQRDGEMATDYLVLTFWDSKDAILQFAGEDMEKARYYPEDSEYFAELEPNVVHYQVMLDTFTAPEK